MIVAATTAAYSCPAAQTSAGPLNCAALPLGDGKVATTGPARGTVYVCGLPHGRGADGPRPWIDTAHGTWNALTKPVVRGSVTQNGTLTVRADAGTLTIDGNGLPVAPVTTGTFPIAFDDPAYRFDRNPNAIAPQTIALSLPADPVAAATPSCVGMGQIGIALDGVAIFNALDAAGNDAVAREAQDACHGHPQQSSMYHYHGWLQTCVSDAGSATRNSSLLGYALDGYGIYGAWYDGKILTSADLDVCHGTTSAVMWHGKLTSIYHYVSTYDYPYTIGCFHGRPVRTR